VEEEPTVAELMDQYGDPDTRKAIFKLINISELLVHCIIRKNYRVPLALYEPIELTTQGQYVQEQLRKRHIPYPEARLICLLEFNLNGLLIDPKATPFCILSHTADCSMISILICSAKSAARR
jgi:hypothetical protein